MDICSKYGEGVVAWIVSIWRSVHAVVSLRYASPFLLHSAGEVRRDLDVKGSGLNGFRKRLELCWFFW